MAVTQSIRRGILQSFNNSTYTATVLIIEATSYVLSNVPIATSVDGTSALAGADCAVLFFDEANPSDAVIIAVYTLAPAPPPGRMTFVTGFEQINAQVITSSNTSTFTLAGGASGIPTGASGVLFKAYFTSPTVGAYINLMPSGRSPAIDYCTVGEVARANGFAFGNGIVQLNASGQIDIQANGGNCTVTLYTYGYVI